MRDYQLAEHVRACITPAGAIFLDLRRDAYSGIDASQVTALQAVVEGWPQTSNGTANCEPDSSALLTSLRAAGLLVHRSEHGSPYSPPQHVEPSDELMPWRHMRPTKVSMLDILLFLRALMTAIFVLRLRPMTAVAARAQRLSSVGAGTFDRERARQQLTLYTYIRMFVFARRGRCLLDSLTLLEFLAARGVHPRWLIGVRLRPFAAHSWLQQQNWVLNGTPAFVRGFHVILTT